MQRSLQRRFSAFAVNPETSSTPHGPPRGMINKFVSMGLPPWAAWCNKVSKYSLYRMSDVARRDMLPKYPQEMDVIWLNERIRQRVRTSRNVNNVYRQLKYPHVRTGIHYSDILDHWVQVPMVQAAMFEVEKDGGFDNFILKRSGSELKSKYGERIRRHILVRKNEIRKNFVLQKQAEHLSQKMVSDMALSGGSSSDATASAAAVSKESIEKVFAEYGVDRQQLLKAIAKRVYEIQRETAGGEVV